jgi:hypothetical protein
VGVESHPGSPDLRSDRPELTGLLFGQLAIGLLGIFVMSAEHATGAIRATLAAVPNRPLVMATKALVFPVVSVVIGLVVSLAAFFIGQVVLSGVYAVVAFGIGAWLLQRRDA